MKLSNLKHQTAVAFYRGTEKLTSQIAKLTEVNKKIVTNCCWSQSTEMEKTSRKRLILHQNVGDQTAKLYDT